ncbi:hypothetical protein [Microvirga roseola]|uniref:hypothetical protein n=1 Tax=Microvirga roseola TaxID=2883126 RepID=UPI001E2D50C0|nr:hypothetical protein [Microvirga roseola]
METDKLKVHSGKCCLCDVGIALGYQDDTGNELHTGDIVVIWHGSYIGTEAEFWDGGDSLTVVVMNQYQSYSDGTVKIQDGPHVPFVMGIRGCGFNDPEWRVRIVKKFPNVVAGEHWPAYGFSYAKNANADSAAIAAAGAA